MDFIKEMIKWVITLPYTIVMWCIGMLTIFFTFLIAPTADLADPKKTLFEKLIALFWIALFTGPVWVILFVD
jgi:hypothetical protein